MSCQPPGYGGQGSVQNAKTPAANSDALQAKGLHATTLPARLKLASADDQSFAPVEVREIESRLIRIANTGSNVPEWQTVGAEVELQFHMGGLQFVCAVTISRINADDGVLWLSKPDSVDRKRVRSTSRLDTHTEVHFTVWTEVGRHQGELLDISEDGLRMLAYHRLERMSLINVDLFLAGDPGVRVNTQATVVWVAADQEGKNLFETGIQFQTLPLDLRQAITEYAASARIVSA